VFEFMESMKSPLEWAAARSSAAFSGLSQGMCSEIPGVAGLAVLQLLEDVARLPGAGEAREARSSRTHPPAGHRHPEGAGPVHQVLDVQAPAVEDPAQVLEVLEVRRLEPSVVVGDLRVAQAEGHVLLPSG
jgi:hypothetical protein